MVIWAVCINVLIWKSIFTRTLNGQKKLLTDFDSLICEIKFCYNLNDRLCGLVVSVADYKHRGPGFDSRAHLRILLRELGLERGPLSLVIG
jgi:hypothetical protein